MVCCALLTLAFALPIWVIFQLQHMAGRPVTHPLTWRLNGAEHSNVARTAVNRFSFGERFASFHYALRGIRCFITREHNAWLELIAAAGAVICGLVLKISLSDWRWIVLAIALVLSAEALNTAVEWIADVVSPGYDKRIGVAKDVAAGAVLLSSIGAVLIGLLTLAPYVFCANGLTTAPFICRSFPTPT